jgi:hypothetical protein
VSRGSEDEEAKARRVMTSRGLALVGLGISSSLDELAIGFGIGLVRLPVVAAVAAVSSSDE